MITTEQIIEAAKETGVDVLTFMYQEKKLRMMDYAMPELQRFANHFYKQGLLDAVEKCANQDCFVLDEATFTACAEAIRQMAEEVK
jgi:hypothetical protein